MIASINFFFHLIGFGVLFTSLLGGWILERRHRTEQDWNQKLYIGKIGSRFGMLSAIASLILLLTGIVNIFNRYGGTFSFRNAEGWLIAKIILFAFLLINGAVFGPVLVRRRSKLIQSILEKAAPVEAETTLRVLYTSISTFYLVQCLLLMIILFLSLVGAGKTS